MILSDNDDKALEGIGKHIITNAIECGEVTDHSNNDLHRDGTWTIEEVMAQDDGTIVVQATMTASDSVRTSRGSRTHPPEYKHYNVELRATATANWAQGNSLAGTNVSMEIHQEGGAPDPRNHEPYEDRL